MTTQAEDPPGTRPGSYAPAPEATAPSLPSEARPVVAPVRSAAAARRTSRRALLVSVLVVLLGGVVAFAGAQMLTGHSQVLAVVRDVPVGSPVTASDLTVASVPKDPALAPIPASDESQIVGMVAEVGLVRGQLLTRAQLGTAAGFGAGQELVALPVKQGQFPARGLTPGEKVVIVVTPGSDSGSTPASTSTSTSASASGSGSGSGITGTVAEVGSMNPATQVTVVDLQVAAAYGVTVARLASTGNLALILLPAGR